MAPLTSSEPRLRGHEISFQITSERDPDSKRYVVSRLPHQCQSARARPHQHENPAAAFGSWGRGFRAAGLSLLPSR
jgi:hypothetical protein